MWQPLAANLCVPLLSLMAWLVLGEQLARLSPARQRLAFAVAMLAGTLPSMMLAFQLSPGVFFDFRVPLLAVSALFGGLPAALLVGGACLLYRLWLGGAVFAGVVSILAALAVGLVAHRLCRSRRFGLGEIIGLAVAVACVNLLVPFTLPAAAREVWLPHWPTPVALSALCTFVVGGLLLGEKRRRELATANMHYRAMVEALPDCLNIKDPDGRFVAANEATAELMRAPSAAALIGRTDFDFYPADLAAHFRADEERIMRAGQHETIEQERRFADGVQGWLSTLKAPVRGDRGEVVALVTHNRDITAAKRMQAELAKTQAYLDQALASMSDGLAMYDADGVLLFCNMRYKTMFPSLGALLDRPGVRFDDIVRAAVLLGEEALAPGLTLDEHVAAKRASLRVTGERVVGFPDGRIFAFRTTVLENGCSLRTSSDVTERVNFERHLEHQALHDPLTGLPNRAHFGRALAHLFDQAQASGRDLVVMLVDLDRFKQINDTYGHATGDALLVEMAHRLQQSVRQGDVVARLGGDEFAVLIAGAADGIDDAGLAGRIARNLARPLTVNDVVLMPSGTIGYTVHPHDPAVAGDLVKNADRALYAAKARRRGSWQCWEPEAERRPGLAGMPLAG